MNPEQHERRRNQALVALKEVIKALVNQDLMGAGKVEVDSSEYTPKLVIPLKSADLFPWEEITHDES